MKQWFIVLLSFLLASLTLSASAQSSTIEWVQRAGQNSVDRANAVATDGAGNVYVTGSISGNNVNFGNSQIANSAGGEDMFLAKYNAAGVCQWVRTAGSDSPAADRGRDVVLDNQGNVYVAGFFNGNAQFPNLQLNSAGQDDAFVAKYDVNGNFQWAAKVGGSQRDQMFGLDVDNMGNVYVIGHFQGEFGVTTVLGNQTVTGNPNDYDVMFAKISGAGVIQWIQSAGGNASDQGWSIEAEGGNVYATGYFSNTATFVGENGNISQTSAGAFDVYLAKLDMNTGLAEWVQTGGGLSSDYGHKITTDAFGGIYLTGRFAGIARFNGTQQTPVTLSSNNNSDDAFIVKYNDNGAVEWGVRAGGTGADFANGISLNRNTGNLYVTGQFQGNFNFANGNNPAFQVNSNGNFDVFLAEYDSNGMLEEVRTWGGNSTDVGSDVVYRGGEAITVGYYNNTFLLNNTPYTSLGQSDVFVTNIGFEDVICNLPTPTITPGTPSSCQQTLTAGNFGSFANNLQWNRNGQAIIGATQTSYTATQSGNYTVEIIDGSCRSASNAVSVNISNNLFVNASASPASINVGQSSTLNATVSGNAGTLAFTWRDINNNVISNNQSVTVSPSQSTSYNVTATDQANGCANQATVTVNVQNTGVCPTEGDVVISIIPGNDNVPSNSSIAEICQGQSTGLQATGFIGNTNFTYSWVRLVNNQPILVRSGTPIIESITIEGDYALNVTAPGCPEVRSNTILVDVFPIPTVSATANQQPGVCNSDPVQLTGFAQGGTPFSLPNSDNEVAEDGYKYRWEPINAIVGNNIRKSVTANPTVATTYTVTVEDRITCGNSTTVSVNPGSPDVAITPGPISLCTGASTTLNVTSVTLGGVQQNIGAYTYQWYNGNAPINGATGSSLLVTASGNYRVQIIANVSGCPNKFSNQTSVSFTASPVANAGADRSVCVGQTVVLGTAPVAGFTYTWSPSAGLSNPNSANPSFVASALGTTIYTVTVSSANCPPASDQVSITVNSDFPAPVISAQGPTQLCQGQAVNLQVNNFDPTVTYSWSRNGVSLGQSGTVISVTTAGTYTVTASGNSVCGAGVKSSNAIAVTFTANPIANAGPDRSICENQSTRIGVPPMPGVTYSWSPFDGFVNNNPNQSNPIVRPAFTTTYTVTAFAGNCPGTSDVVTVTVTNRPPAPSIVANGPTAFCAGGSVELSITNYDPNLYAYEWYNNGFRIGQSGPSILVARSGNYYAEARLLGSENTACNSANSNSIGVSVTEDGFLPVPKIYPFGSANIGICGNNVTMWTDRVDNYTYQWWKDGDIIPGATDTFLVANEPGIYHIQVIEANCISKKSEGLFITEKNVAGPSIMTPRDFSEDVICSRSNLCLPFVGSTNHPNGNLMWSVSNNGFVTDTRTEMDTFIVCARPLNSNLSYTVTLTDDYGCTADTTVFINVRDIEAPFISGGGLYCRNETVNLNVNNPQSFDYLRWWRRADSTSGDINNPYDYDVFAEGAVMIEDANGNMVLNESLVNPVINEKGRYYVEGSIEGCGLIRSNFEIVEFNPAPRINSVTSNRSVVCPNNNDVILNVSATNTTELRYDNTTVRGNTLDYSWNAFNGSIVNNFNSSRADGEVFVDTTMFSVVVTNNFNCTSEGSVTVASVPEIAFGLSGDAIICSNESTLLTINDAINPNYTYRWEQSTNGGVSFTTASGTVVDANNFRVGGFSGNRVYRVRATYSNGLSGCTYTVFSNTVTVESERVFNNFDARIANWRTAQVQGGYRLENAGDAISICYGETFALYLNSGVNTNVSYEWFRVDNGFENPITTNTGSFGSPNFIDVNSPFYPDTATESATYRLRATSPSGICTVIDEVTVSIAELGPKADAKSSDEMICQGQTVELLGFNIGTTGPGVPDNLPNRNRFVTYRWNGPVSDDNPTGLLAFGDLQGSATAVPALSVTPKRTTTYTLTLASPYSNCVSTCPVTVKVGPRLVATVQNVEGRDNLCEGPVTLRSISNSTNADVRYQWYTDSEHDDIWVPIPGATSEVFMPKVGGRYNVRVYNEDFMSCYDDADNWQTLSGVRGGDMEADDLITVKKADYLHSDMQLWEVQTKPVVICPGQSVELRARYIFGASYQWYRVTGPASMPSYEVISGANSRSYTAMGSGKYKVMVTAGCFDCPDVCETWSQTCPVVQIPELKPTVHHVGQINFCENEFVKLYTQGNEMQYNYQWYRDGVAIPGANMKEYIVEEDNVAEVGGTRFTVEVGSKYIPTDGSVCHAMSENEVTVFDCHEVLCPEPTSLRAIPVEKDMSAVIIRWDKPLQNSLYQLTDEYELRWRRVGTTAWTTRIIRDMYEYKAEGLAEGTYEVQVRAWCVENTQSAWHPAMPVQFVIGEGSAPANCNAVSNVVASVNADGSVRVTWNSASGTNVNSYDVFYRLAGTGSAGWVLAGDNVSGTSFTLNASFFNADDNYQAGVVTNCDNNLSSADIASNVFGGLCNAVVEGSVTIQNITQTTATISWDEPAGNPGSYIVEYTSDPSFLSGVQSVSTNVENVTLSGLSANTSYFYRIITNCSNAPFVELPPFTTLESTGGSDENFAIRWVVNQSVTSNSALILWDTNNDSENYSLRYRLAGSSNDFTVVNGLGKADAPFQIDGLSAATEYVVNINANDPSDPNEWTADLNVTTLPVGDQNQTPVADGPARIICDGNNILVDIQWQDVPGASGYQVEWKNINAQNWFFETDGNEQSIIPFGQNIYQIQDGITPNADFEVRIRAVFPGNEVSEWTYILLNNTPDCATGKEGAFEVAASDYNVYPNPNNGQFNVSFDAASAGEITINMMDVTGKSVYRNTFESVEGANNIAVETQNIAAGVYMVQIINSGEVNTTKVIVE